MVAGLIALDLIALAWLVTRTEPPTSVDVVVIAIVIALLIGMVFHLNKRIAKLEAGDLDRGTISEGTGNSADL